jgi:hypothetical protein
MRYLTVVLLVFVATSIKAQVGGTHTYDFLNLTNSARVAALGGKNISLNDNDLNLSFHNPALLTPETSHNLVVNYVNYYTDVNYGYVSYASDRDSLGTFALGLHYLNYGTFTKADAGGTINGSFTAAEYALNIIYSKSIIDSAIRVGVNVKPIYSQLYKYHSLGLVADLGITYTNKEKMYTVAAVIRNMGSQITSYTGTYEPVPFEIQLGITKKLEYAPFRFSLTLQQLQKLKMTYTDTIKQGVDPNTGELIEKSKIAQFADNSLRHCIFGVDFLPTKNFYFSLAYNYQRRQELAIVDRPGMTGLSWGFGFKISRFRLSYGRATYHVAGASNHFSISTNLAEFYSR